MQTHTKPQLILELIFKTAEVCVIENKFILFYMKVKSRDYNLITPHTCNNDHSMCRCKKLDRGRRYDQEIFSPWLVVSVTRKRFCHMVENPHPSFRLSVKYGR